MPPAQKERTGKIIEKTVSNIKSLATKVKSQDLNAAVETIVADAIVLPTEKTATNAGGGGAVVSPKNIQILLKSSLPVDLVESLKHLVL